MLRQGVGSGETAEEVLAGLAACCRAGQGRSPIAWLLAVWRAATLTDLSPAEAAALPLPSLLELLLLRGPSAAQVNHTIDIQNADRIVPKVFKHCSLVSWFLLRCKL